MDDLQSITEVERKLAVDETFEIPDLAVEVPEIERTGARRRVVLEATYFDTSGFDLLMAGITLRRRVGGDDAGWHLKLPEGDQERSEIQVPLSATTEIPRSVSAALNECLAVTDKLRPVLQMRTERSATDLFGHDGQRFAEVADDRVLAMNLTNGKTSTWHEVEIEQRGNSTTVIDRVSECLRNRGARDASYPSKLSRGLGDRSDHRSTTNPVINRLVEQFAQLLSCEADVRLDVNDGVHRMRVASRRLRSCLKTFRRMFRKDATLQLEAELKWIGDQLGVARDAEVLADRVGRDLDIIDHDVAVGPVRNLLLGQLSDNPTTARKALFEALDAPRFRDLLQVLGSFINNPPLRPGRTRTKWLQRQVTRTIRRTRRRVAKAKRVEAADQDSAMHDVRKAAKYVRYGAETLAPIIGKPAHRLASRYENLQEVLGEHHDAVTARELFRSDGMRQNENGFTYGVLYALEDARIRNASTAFRRAWKAARAAKT